MNKLPRLTLILAAVLLPFCSSVFCFGQDSVQSNSEARSILQEVALLSTQVENLRDRMVVCVQLGLANWKSGDSVSAKVNFDDALKLIDDFPPQERFSDLYRQSIAEVQAELGEFEAAHLTLGRIKDDSQRSEAYRVVGLAQALRRDFEGAILNAPFIEDPENRDDFLQTISKMRSEANTPHGPQDSEVSFEADNSCADIAAADTISLPDDKAPCLAYWGGKLATEGQFNAALEMLRRAHQEASLLLDSHVRASTLEEIAMGQARAGAKEEATQSLAEAESIALARYRQGWSGPIEPVVELKVEWGNFDGAGSTLAKVKDNEKINTLVRVASAVVKNGDKKRAYAWANHQTSPRGRAFTLLGIASAILVGKESSAILR